MPPVNLKRQPSLKRGLSSWVLTPVSLQLMPLTGKRKHLENQGRAHSHCPSSSGLDSGWKPSLSKCTLCFCLGSVLMISFYITTTPNISSLKQVQSFFSLLIPWVDQVALLLVVGVFSCVCSQMELGPQSLGCSAVSRMPSLSVSLRASPAH